MWSREMVRTVVGRKEFAVAVGSVLSAAVSSLVTREILRKRLSEHYKNELEEQVEAAEVRFKKLYKVEEYSEPPGYDPEEHVDISDAVEKLREAGIGALANYQRGLGIPVETPVETEIELETVETVTSIFSEVEPSKQEIPEEWVANRGVVDPFVISHDEFYTNEPEHRQMDLTYYNVDGVLADEQDIPVPKIGKVVGVDNLAAFGVGSGDKNKVFIRNPRIGVDYEVSLAHGSFAKLVHGVEDADEGGQLKHSAQRHSRRRREMDD